MSASTTRQRPCLKQTQQDREQGPCVDSILPEGGARKNDEHVLSLNVRSRTELSLTALHACPDILHISSSFSFFLGTYLYQQSSHFTVFIFIGDHLSNANSTQVGFCSLIPKNGWVWPKIACSFKKLNKNKTRYKQSVTDSPLENFRGHQGSTFLTQQREAEILKRPKISRDPASAPTQIQLQGRSQQLGLVYSLDRDGQVDFQDKNKRNLQGHLSKTCTCPLRWRVAW